MSSFLFEIDQVDCDIATPPSTAPTSPVTDGNVIARKLTTTMKATCSSSSGNYQSHLTNYIDDSNKLLLLLDYDGTLAPIVSHPDLALLSKETRRVLTSLSLMPSVSICIMSGRSLDNLQKVSVFFCAVTIQFNNEIYFCNSSFL